VAALSLLLFFSAGAALDRGSTANANSEASALVSYFNQYRIPPLVESSALDTSAQAASMNSLAQCGYILPNPSGVSSYTTWQVYGYSTAAEVWAAQQTDSSILSVIANPAYNAAGIGFAHSDICNLGNLWTIIVAHMSGITLPPTPSVTPATSLTPTSSSTPTPTPTATPAHTPIPTPTLATTTPTPTPTASPNPSDTNTVYPTLPDRGTPPPTESPGGSTTPTDVPPTTVPTVTPPTVMPGDVDCDGTINMGDVLLVLKVIAHVPAIAACLSLAGVDCTGGVDAADALVLLEFIEGIPYHLPDGCPSFGSPTPAPTPLETPTPTPTATLEPTETPTPAITPVPLGINHCEFAMIAYHLDTNESLDGFEHCTPGAGTAYDCAFSADGYSAACTASSSDFPNYSCSFIDSNFGDCVPDAGAPEYQCFDNGAHMVECLPTHTGYAWYDCAVSGDDVTCTSVAPTPNFACRHEGIEFSCLALPPTTPTTSPG
jgi:hypothetical protein